MNYTRFDRHENMSSETRKEILSLTGESSDFNLTNMLYGLFDGYLYNDILEVGQSEFGESTMERLESVVETVKTYPTLS